MKLREIERMGFSIEIVETGVTVFSRVHLDGDESIDEIQHAPTERVDETYDDSEVFYNVYSDDLTKEVLLMAEHDVLVEFFNTGFKEKYYQKYAEMALGRNGTIGYIKFLKYCIEHPAENALDDLAREEFKRNWDHEFMNIARRQ